MRNEKKPFRVESSSLGEVSGLSESQLPEVNGCYCESARTDDSGGLGNEVSQMKGAERRDKLSV